MEFSPFLLFKGIGLSRKLLFFATDRSPGEHTHSEKQ